MLEKLDILLKPKVNLEAKLTAISLFFAKYFSAIELRIISLESRQLQKGDKGDKGDSGMCGMKGMDGMPGIHGKDGISGKDGKTGKDGKDGVSVVDSYIAPDGNFMFKLSNGKEIDAGNPLELETSIKNSIINTQIANFQITVSTTAPASPQLNQLWLDIN